MTDKEDISVQNQETAAPESNLEDQSQSQVAEKTDVKAEPAVGTKEYNWRRLEEKNKQLERQLEEIKRMQEESKNPTPPKEEDELNSLDDDDIITVAQAKKLSQKQAEELINKALEKREKASLPEKTRGRFTDYDAVMTEENIRKLEQTEPELAKACMHAHNPWEATYKILKKFVAPTEEQKLSKGESKLQENLNKPASSNSVGRQSPLANANLWSEASKQELYMEMMNAASQVKN